ncbi:MAG: hypothetical protein BGN87_17425 [Rhizobiales bacterium 65-79]|nr:MAG: hypothetical protein BGN87_17425 [Rhizobiales bacterium 65-79]
MWPVIGLLHTVSSAGRFVRRCHQLEDTIMKKTAILAALATLAFAGAATAGEMEGTVKTVNMGKHMITLTDGMSVMTNKDVKLDHVMKGDHVKIMTDKNKMGTMVEKMK